MGENWTEEARFFVTDQEFSTIEKIRQGTQNHLKHIKILVYAVEREDYGLRRKVGAIQLRANDGDDYAAMRIPFHMIEKDADGNLVKSIASNLLRLIADARYWIPRPNNTAETQAPS